MGASPRPPHISAVLTTLHWLPMRTTLLCSRLWCWCGSVLMALLPATSPNSAFPLPLLQVVSVLFQPWWTYCKFLKPEPRPASGSSPSRDRHCGTVFLLLRGDGDDAVLYSLPSSDNWTAICSTSDELTFTTARRCCGQWPFRGGTRRKSEHC